jgi:hypothetical protein
MCLAALGTLLFLKEKEKKESPLRRGGFKRSPVFLKKYYSPRRMEIFSKTRRA